MKYNAVEEWEEEVDVYNSKEVNGERGWGEREAIVTKGQGESKRSKRSKPPKMVVESS